MKRTSAHALWVGAGLIAFLASGVRGEPWTAWRGDSAGSGVAPATVAAPIQWSATEGVVWKTAMPGRGNSTPIVWEDQVFVTQTMDSDQRRTLMCFDRRQGKLLWQQGPVWKEEERSHETNPYCSSSPVTDGQRVVAWFGSAGVYAYDFSGKELWRRDLGRQDHEWGYGSSPIMHGDLCILFFGPGERQFLVALDKRTGKIVWQADPPPLEKRPRTDGFRGREQGGIVGTFSSPILVSHPSGLEVVMTYPQWMVAYDPATGKERWRCDGLNELIYASPIAGDGAVVGMGGFTGTSMGVRAGGSGDVTATHRLWQEPRTKNRLGSGLIYEGNVYVLNSDGIAECFDLKTGLSHWEERLPSKGSTGQSWSSLVLAGGHIYAPNQSGDVVVFKASPAFEVVRVNSIGSELTNASLVLAGGQAFLRTHEHLWCFGARQSGEQAPAPTSASGL